MGSCGPSRKVWQTSSGVALSPISWASTLAVPQGIMAKGTSVPVIPAAAALIVPSPPAATTASYRRVRTASATRRRMVTKSSGHSRAIEAPWRLRSAATSSTNPGRLRPAPALTTRKNRRRMMGRTAVGFKPPILQAKSARRKCRACLALGARVGACSFLVLAGGFLHRRLHLLEGAHLDLPDALPAHAELGGEILQSCRLLGQPPRLEDAFLSLVQG